VFPCPNCGTKIRNSNGSPKYSWTGGYLWITYRGDADTCPSGNGPCHVDWSAHYNKVFIHYQQPSGLSYITTERWYYLGAGEFYSPPNSGKTIAVCSVDEQSDVASVTIYDSVLAAGTPICQPTVPQAPPPPPSPPVAPPPPCVPVTFALNTKTWASEISWQVDDGLVTGPSSLQDNSAVNTNACLSPGVYTLKLMDSFGDGWNGGTISVISDPPGEIFLGSTTVTTGKNLDVTFSITDSTGTTPTPAPTPAPTHPRRHPCRHSRPPSHPPPRQLLCLHLPLRATPTARATRDRGRKSAIGAVALAAPSVPIRLSASIASGKPRRLYFPRRWRHKMEAASGDGSAAARGRLNWNRQRRLLPSVAAAHRGSCTKHRT